MGGMDSVPICLSNGPSSFTQCKFDRHGNGDGDGHNKCKQAFKINFCYGK